MCICLTFYTVQYYTKNYTFYVSIAIGVLRTTTRCNAKPSMGNVARIERYVLSRVTAGVYCIIGPSAPYCAQAELLLVRTISTFLN